MGRWDYNEDTQTLVGTKKRRLIDEDTGEKIEADQIFKRALGQRQFWKIYLIDFLQVLGVLDSKQIDILIYILEHTQAANNTFIGTYTKIQQAVGVAPATVAKVMTKLQEKKFIRKIQNGVWQVSEHIMMKGDENKKQLLISYYQENHKKEPKSVPEPLPNTAQQPEEPEIETPEFGCCPKCGKPLLKRDGKKGAFIGCSGYPLCKFSKDVSA